MDKKQKGICVAGSFFAGLINGALGAGGGMLTVPVLKKAGLEQKNAHATSIAIILPLSVISAATYLINGTVTVYDALPYLPLGVVGAVAGAFIIGKIPDNWLRRIFSLFMIWAGIRMLMR